MDRRARIEAAMARRLGSVVAVCEAVRRRHNVSAILRTCEAFGVHEVHLVTAGFVPVAGAARGAERWVHLRCFETVTASIAELHARGFRVYVADLAEESFTPESVPVDGPVALVFGSELRGVSREAHAASDGAVRIPMHGLVQSLNVSVSAAILLRAVTERRRAVAGPDLGAVERARFVGERVADEEVAERGLRARTGESG